MKRWICLILTLLCLTGCSVQKADETAQSSDIRVDAVQKKEMTGNQIRVLIGDQTFTAQLEDNDTAKAFLNELPMSLHMSELNGNEKYSYNVPLPSDAEAVGSISSGDLMLYGDNCLVLFYDSFSTGYSYTKIGHITNPDGLAEAVGNGDISITFTK